MILGFDTETTGLADMGAPSSALHQPHLVQLAAIRINDRGEEVSVMDRIVRPDGWTIPPELAALHGISTERALDEGLPLVEVIDEFNAMLEDDVHLMVAHNAAFDAKIMRIAFHRSGRMPVRENLPKFDTCRAATNIVKLPPTPKMVKAGMGNRHKPPKLEECIRHFFGEELGGAHNALIDVRACIRVYMALVARGTVAA